MELILEKLLYIFQNECYFFGGENKAHLASLLSISLTLIYYFTYFIFAKYIRGKTIIRNPEIEKIGFSRNILSQDQLMIKYSGNLSASSTMAALSVTMVLLSVAALFQTKLKPYDHFVAVIVCTLMTMASVGLLFAHELYDAILNPLFNSNRRFKLRKLGANFQAIGLFLFIVSMLLAISTVSSCATIVSSVVCCIVMTIYIEIRLVDLSEVDDEIYGILKAYKRGYHHE